MSKNKNKKPLYKRIWFWIVAVIVFFVVIAAVTPSDDDSNSSSKSSSSKSVSSKKKTNSNDTNKESDQKNKQYNDSDALTNAQNFSDDDYRNDSNIGKSVHLTNAKIARVDKTDGGLWIATTTDMNSDKMAHVQAVNLASYKFKEGDTVDIQATLQGMKKSMVTTKGDTEKYPTIWITSITKTN
ncbi:hypothetical protein [Fructobacillus fructosus]|uniref:Uncharacterized protein n=1 Tax=Fructobacillus fructosus TaxID=1631 RepID=A0ABN9YTM5_9LACO|nr:hypothetical protein [Fructobacillus fructosus]MBC9118616.1 hypothetical protein [Fructobacillus fructosus]MBD9365093.1 hypothetical protein [Leuconostoc mesenteroides]CAK1233088.1 unnamed protein product [Fructobacillus fructosus]CAK1244968.1 unnamed protein product [Fructobacillus fructosus]